MFTVHAFKTSQQVFLTASFPLYLGEILPNRRVWHRAESKGMVQKFNLYARTMCVIVVNTQDPLCTALVLATPFQRRNKTKISIFSQ